MNKSLKLESSEFSYLKSIGQNLLVKGVAIPMSFLCGVLLARYLGVDDYGLYAITISYIALACAGLVRAISVTVVKEVAAAITSGEFEKINGVVLISIAIILISAGFFLVAESVFAESSYQFFDSFLELIILTLALTLVGSMLRGLMRPTTGLFVEQALKPLIQCIIIIIMTSGVAVAAFNYEDGIDSLKVSLFLSLFVGILFLFYIIKTSMPIRGISIQKKWLIKSIPLLIFLGYMQGFNVQLPIVMMSIFSESSEVAFFKVGMALPALIGMILVAVNVALGPRISSLIATNNWDEFNHLLRVSCSVVIAIVIPMIIFFIFFSETIILNIFGNDYEKSIEIIIILCVAQFISCYVGPLILTLNMLNRETINIVAILISIATSIISGCILIPDNGSYGAALTYLFSVLASSFYLFLKSMQVRNINYLPYFRLSDYQKYK
ncbi:MAG: MATE family efflux transporter [Pseudomonadales bacterium]|nr:MATE family efflux transporter [Pseudomonadales bacterium]